jgi:hypothetical protein
LQDRLGESRKGGDTAFLVEGEDMRYCEYGKDREESGDHQ